jgi:predicted amidohydrolase
MEPLFVEPVPMDLVWKGPEANLAAMNAELTQRLTQNPEIPSFERLFLFPELTLTGFVTQKPEGFTVVPADPWIEKLCALARSKQTAICVGFPEVNPDAPERPFNTLALIGPDGQIVARYRKMHLFTLGENPEANAYSPGTTGVVTTYRGWRIGLATCFDIRFSALFHAYAREKAELILVSACWVGGPHKSYQYQTVNSGHAVLTQAYVAAVNRSGKDPFFEYDGASYVFSPFGEDISKGQGARLDPAELKKARGLAVRVADREQYPVRSS